MILLDANILLRLTNANDPEYQRIQRVVFQYRQNDTLVLAAQSLFEFWAVATRSKDVNGIGMDVQRARHWVATCRRMFCVLPETETVLTTWASLVEEYGVTGFRAHDTHYVATMQVHGITRLMTYNVKHFVQYPITIIDPAASGSAT